MYSANFCAINNNDDDDNDDKIKNVDIKKKKNYKQKLVVAFEESLYFDA